MNEIGIRKLNANQVFTAFIKALIFDASFTPAEASTPELTSTIGAPVAAIAAATLSGVRPPARR